MGMGHQIPLFSLDWWSPMNKNRHLTAHDASHIPPQVHCRHCCKLIAPILATRLCLSIDETAEAVGISRSAVYEHMARGLPSKKASTKKRVVVIEALIAYINSLPDASSTMEADSE
jgi:predicted DNA-binding transcriptional regulator AlpA